VASAYGWVTRVLSMVKRAHIFHILTIKIGGDEQEAPKVEESTIPSSTEEQPSDYEEE
jgi:hypothetical protein